MNFVMLNPEKIWQENLTGWSISPIRCRYFTLGNPKSHYNSIIHIYFWLFMLYQKKTNCNPLAHPTWKCHHTNWWIAKLFHRLKVCCVLSNVGNSERAICGLSSVALKRTSCSMWQLECQASNVRNCSEWPPSALVHASSLFRHWSVA